MSDAFMHKIVMVSLGCDKNTADSSKMLSLLSARGYELVNEPEEAEAAIVNTCCFISSATEESLNKIFELSLLKKDKLKYLVCAGCMAERYREEISKQLPEVDAFVGTGNLDTIADVIDELFGSEEKKVVMSFDGGNTAFLTGARQREYVMTEQPYTEFLKIADGCDKRCTYCAIPYFKGHFRSVPMEDLIAEAKGLAANGVKELTLVAQETTSYGIDLYKEKKLHELLRKLSEIEELKWIRLLYCYPEEIYPELIEEMAVNPKVLHYIDMPIQHTEDSVLKRMGRRIDKAGIIDVVGKLRSRMPDITIRTTLITGFPGETPENHEAVLDTLDELKFDRVGVFTYSAEEGTPAAKFPDQVDEEVKERYRDEIMELCCEISEEKNEQLVGTEMDVIIEGYLPDDAIYVARSYRDALDVDGQVFVYSDRELMSGDIVRVKIIEHSSYDLTGKICEEEW